ncbi:hypothetical protein [Spiroplasma endosymbiont of Nomada rufipes]|uniref:hypothetical protein n=1 Tax=Spiroplasma endosymbiont of Nomada rufipes TaxID=3077933 RepID=UPI00376F1A54
MIEQHPNRITVQAKEKVEYVVQVKRMRFLGFVVIFNLNLYTNIDDYNKVVFSRRRTKKMIKKALCLQVIVVKQWLWLYFFLDTG